MTLNKFMLEHTECDFKREVEHKKTKNWLKSVCAFANGIGGVLVFGVDDKTRQYCPINDMQGEIEFITECIKDRISPIPEFVLEPETVDGNDILVLKVSGGLLTPYYLTDGSSKITFIRAGASSVLADTPILHELILKGTNRTWDTLKSEYEARNFSFTFLESYYFNKTGKHLTSADYLSFGFVSKDGFLTNAGALFADLCPLLQSRIFCTRWNGLTKAPSSLDALDDKEFSGNILQLLTASQDFIKIHNAKMWYKEPRTRVEKLSYPERAIFEILVNALVHRDYGVIGSEIHIDMFDDRLTITNPGGMYDGVPVQNQNIEDVISTRRNPVVADFMTRLDLMERRGSGFRKILDAIKREPNYKETYLPDITSTPYSFSFTLKNMNYSIDSTTGGQKSGLNMQKCSENSQDNKEKTRKKTRKKTREKIIQAIKENPNITVKELAKLIGITPKGVEWQLKQLREKGCIRRVGADKGGYWEIVENCNVEDGRRNEETGNADR